MQNNSGVTVIVGVNEANNKLILKKTDIKIVSDYLITKYMQHRTWVRF
jgi:hypothetical protein